MTRPDVEFVPCQCGGRAVLNWKRGYGYCFKCRLGMAIDRTTGKAME